jgi:hypothetical protein
MSAQEREATSGFVGCPSESSAGNVTADDCSARPIRSAGLLLVALGVGIIIAARESLSIL